MTFHPSQRKRPLWKMRMCRKQAFASTALLSILAIALAYIWFKGGMNIRFELESINVRSELKAINANINSRVKQGKRSGGFHYSSEPKKMADGDHLVRQEDARWPKIVWLMSYPNSGTSYTMNLVRRASNKAVATNYGKESKSYIEENEDPYPLYPDSPEGPFILNPGKDLPSKFIMTKTHCGSRCTECSSKGYLETKESFLDKCASARARGNEKHSNYGTSEIGKAIRLVRNPFDNVVSNFHLNVKHASNETEQQYSNDKNGFRKWCHHLDTTYEDEEKASNAFPGHIIKSFQGVPCHKVFYTLVQWHNYASEVINDLRLPSLTIRYEEYEHALNTTTQNIFDFLELCIEGKIHAFQAGKRYETEFFTREERVATKNLVKMLSDEETWRLLRPYFVNL